MIFRVVLADDEERIRLGMARQIESMGLPLRVAACASDGVEALAMVEKYSPEIVLMDINMPFMDGLECIRRVREKDPDCVIIIVSGYDRFDYARKALEYGVDSYLLKPVEDEEFEGALKNAILKYTERRNRLSAPRAAPGRESGQDNVAAYIKEHYADKELSMEKLESLFNMSRSALFKTVKNITGLSTIDFIISLRIERAKSLLLDKRRYSVKEVCCAVGYDDQHYFSRVFKRIAGCSPSQYREERAQ